MKKVFTTISSLILLSTSTHAMRYTLANLTKHKPSALKTSAKISLYSTQQNNDKSPFDIVFRTLAKHQLFNDQRKQLLTKIKYQDFAHQGWHGLNTILLTTGALGAPIFNYLFLAAAVYSGSIFYRFKNAGLNIEKQHETMQLVTEFLANCNEHDNATKLLNTLAQSTFGQQNIYEFKPFSMQSKITLLDVLRNYQELLQTEQKCINDQSHASLTKDYALLGLENDIRKVSTIKKTIEELRFVEGPNTF